MGLQAVESANIVGYMNVTNTVGKQFSPVGAMFMNCSTNGAWRLGDIKPVDGTLNYQTEYLQEFDPNTGAIGTMYCYIDAASATSKNPMRKWANPADAVGWWYKDTISGMTASDQGTAVRADNVVFSAGQGLYSNFVGAKAKLDFSGEVVCEEWQIDLTGKQFSPIINYLPRVITLKEIVPEEGTLNYQTEYLQEFDPNTGAIGTMYCYIDAASATSKNPMRKWANPSAAVGWWYKDTISGMTATDQGTAVKADDVEIKPGEGFYSNFVSAKAKLNFPKSIPDAN